MKEVLVRNNIPNAVSLNDPSSAEGVTPLLVNVPDACKMLGVRKSKLYELADSGSIQKVKLGGKALVTVVSIEALVARLVKERAR